jgi:long-chain fatty acid transport protein
MKRYYIRNSIAVIITVLLITFSSLSHAGGPVHGARAAGMGTAFAAVSDDSSAIVHNVAGMTQVKGTNIYGGPTLVIISSEYKSPSGESEDTDFQVFFPPHLYITSDFWKDNVVVGFGIYAPFGIGGRKWDSDGLTRYASIESFIATLSLTPSIAIEVFPGLSLGAGIEYMRALNKAERKIDQSLVNYGDAKLEIEADGGGWGYRLGLLFKPYENLSFGVAYRSEIDIDQDGDLKLSRISPMLQPLFGGSSFKSDIETTLDFPQVVDIGIAYRPTKKLTLAFDAEWVGWSSFEEAVLDLETEVPGAGFSDSSAPLDWEDVWFLKLGVEYEINDIYAIRGGYVYGETFVPDHTLGPDNPDSEQHNFSIGFSYKKDKWTMDFFYNAGFFEDRKVENDILSGEYDNFVQFAGSSLNYLF